MGAERAEGLDDVQHLFVILVPDDGRRGRILVVRKKRLPELDTTSSLGLRFLGVRSLFLCFFGSSSTFPR